MTTEATKTHIMELAQNLAVSWAAANHLQSQKSDDDRVERAREALDIAVTEALKGRTE